MDGHRYQEMLAVVSQRAKFGLWNFARRHPVLGAPIHALGRLSTTNLGNAYRLRLGELGESMLPLDRYVRTPEISTQLLLVTGKDASATRALSLLFNHLRIPYRKITREEFRFETWPADMTVFSDCENGIPDGALGKFLNINALKARELLPWESGLLSPATASLVRKLAEACDEPLVTGMLPTRAALRLDDIEGRGIGDYLPPMLQRGWRPNLGLFLNGFGGLPDEEIRRIADLARVGEIDVSPHAFTADDFLFFDYPRGRPFSSAEFGRRWERAKKMLNFWGLPLSEAVNAHFHAISRDALEVMAEDGIRWHYGELTPGRLTRDPAPEILPGGDPTCTTGQIGERVRRIYSGDTALDCNQSASLYDFLMHAGEPGTPDIPARRILRRLDTAFQCGFAAFITTHEYLLNALPKDRHDALWNEVEDGLKNLAVGPVKKITMSEMGRICGDHTDTLIESVMTKEPRRFEVGLSGISAGHGFLTIFWRGRFTYFKIPKFQGTFMMEIAL